VRLRTVSLWGALVVVLGIGLAAEPASAAPFRYDTTFNDTNDCTGKDAIFSTGNGFALCDVGEALGDGVEVSPVLVKYDANGNFDETATSAIDGSEITVDTSAGTWTYTPDSGDPEIRFWSVKFANNVTLYWMADDLDGAESDCEADLLSKACFDSALVVTSGTFDTSSLSHVTFYDGGDIPPPPPPVIPEPASLLLMGTGLLGVGARLARSRSRRRVS